MVVIIVQAKSYELDPKEASVMKYIQEAQALEKGHQITINNINHHTFEFIRRILATLNYHIQQPPKIINNVLEDHIGKPLANLIGHLSSKELNQLYRAVHYLKIYALRRCIAAVSACRVYVEPTLQSYQRRKEALGPANLLTCEKTKQYKERFPFIN